jgi:hypothetical protein
MARKFFLGYPPTHKSFRPYVTAIGQAAIAWNGLHEALRSLFGVFLASDDPPTHVAIWYSQNNDRAQRNILRALARTDNETGNVSDDVYQRVKWLLDEADNLATVRDAAIHAPLISDAKAIVPYTFHAGLSGHPKAKKLLDKHLLTEFRWCRDTAITLTDFCLRLEFALTRVRPTALPDIPSLPDRRSGNGTSA